MVVVTASGCFLVPELAFALFSSRAATARSSAPAHAMRLASVAVGCLFFLLLSPQEAAATESDEGSLAIACASNLTPENVANGFGAEADDDCKTDPNECFQINCRLCKERNTTSTTGLTACEDVRKKQVTRVQAAATLLQPQLLEQSLESAMIFEVAPESLSSTDCAARVSKGDQDAGLTAVYNAGCANGGVGCFSDVYCQFCRLSPATTQQFKLCSELPVNGGSTATTAAPSVDCAAAVTNSGYTDASFVTDSECLKAASPEGCVKASTCRLCREIKNEGNQHLSRCKVLRDQQALASVAESASVSTLVMAASTATTTVTANTKSGSDPSTSPTSGSGPDVVATIAAVSVGAVVALAAVAVNNSRARRVANGSTGEDSGGDLHRIDSIVNEIGRDRIATL